MIKLKNKQTSGVIGEITEDQLKFLIDMWEEEDSEDRDYWIDQTTLDYFLENGGDPNLIKLLQVAIEGKEGVEIEWSSE